MEAVVVVERVEVVVGVDGLVDSEQRKIICNIIVYILPLLIILVFTNFPQF